MHDGNGTVYISILFTVFWTTKLKAFQIGSMYDPRSLFIKFPKLPSPGVYALIYSFCHFSVGIITMLVNIFHFTPFDHVTCMFYVSCNSFLMSRFFTAV